MTGSRSSDDFSENPGYLKAKIRIGSIKGPISYGVGQQVFHHDDIPEVSRARKNEVREWARSKILSSERRDWNIGTRK